VDSTKKIVLGVLFWPLGLYWLLRRFHFRPGVAIGLPAVLFIALIAGVSIAASSSSKKTSSPPSTGPPKSTVHSCGRILSPLASETFVVTTTGTSCVRARSAARSFFTPASDASGWVDNCLSGVFPPGNQQVKACPQPTRAQRRSHQFALARAAKVARQRAAARATAARQRASARARAHAAYVAAANAWHRGYQAYDYGAGIYYRWRNDLSCAQYASYCWRIEVVVRDGCSSLFVEANEKDSSGTIVGDLIDSRDNIPPKTPALLELDSTVNNSSDVASAPTITCNP
jgi:hypothetical protein